MNIYIYIYKLLYHIGVVFNGKETGSYYSILGLYWDNGKEMEATLA